jgi:ubiquitin carboxyl-terminal hydrolase 4/11/15
MVTSAAYLLFYRRRSSKPLGGPRFAEIFAKYGHPDDDEDSESGTVTSRPSLLDRTSNRTRITPLTGPDDEDDEDDILPSYGVAEQIETIQDSIEDESLDMPGGYQTTRPKSLSMAQGWNFNGLGQNGDATDGASDDVQLGSSSSERGVSPDFEDQDMDMATVTGAHEVVETSDVRHTSLKGKDGVISVPPPGAKGGDDSDEVTEIHLDGSNSN